MTAAEAGPAAIVLNHVSVGAGIHIHDGDAAESREPFLAWHDLPADPEAAFSLLSWRVRLASLAGRDREIGSLVSWARTGPKARIRLLSGGGGLGKSRLAAEIAERLRGEGWTAGFVRPNDPMIVPLRRAGLLLVVDYPEEQPSNVVGLIRDLATTELGEVPVRLLLLSRQGAERWFDIIESVHAGDLFDAQEVGLETLTADDAWAVFEETRQRLTRHYSGTLSQITENQFGAWLERDRALHSTPLIVTAAAIHAFLDPAAGLVLTGKRVVEALTQRERSRLDSAGNAAGLGGKSMSRLVALAAVPGSLDGTAIKRLARPALQLGLPPAEQVIDKLSALPWWHDNRISAPVPDVMAAALLVKILHDRPDAAPAWLWTVIEGVPLDEMIGRLGRLIYDATTVHGSAAAIVWRSLNAMVAGRVDRAIVVQALISDDHLPVSLSAFAATITRGLLSVPVEPAQRAALLKILASRLNEAGDVAGALSAVEEAIQIYRKLTAENPPHFEPHLALSLNVLSNVLNSSGNTAGELAAIREAVGIFRRLAARDPAQFEQDLAGTLSNLAHGLHEFGDSEGALTAIRESVVICRRMAAADSKRFELHLARSLNNLANILTTVGDVAGALEPIQQAVEIRRKLVKEHPARFEHDLAGNLLTLTSVLATLGRRQDALAACRESVGIHRRLASENRARFAPPFAGGLRNLARLLYEFDKPAEALTTLHESIAVWRWLASQNQARHEPNLASSLNDLAAMLHKLGDVAGALAAIQPALDIRRRLASANPRKYAADLSRSQATFDEIRREPSQPG